LSELEADVRLAELVAHAERLFPGQAHFLAIASEAGGLRVSAKVPEPLRRTLLKDFLYTFKRESELVITSVVVVPKEKPRDQKSQTPQNRDASRHKRPRKTGRKS